ncbi:MAG: hypothetical protein NZM25_06495 [Leptospiraceae bacterium]|nr:hypothetical protein [Leptospiraceae bacterium]MDW8306575.1 hypothetical protein [Leptospiraceae bacterium]
MNQKNILQLGKIQRPRGLKGELRVITTGELLYHRIPQKVSLYRAMGHAYGFLEEPIKEREIWLTSIRREGPALHIVTLDGITTREAAEELRGLYFGISLETAMKRYGGGDPPYLFEYIYAKVRDVVEENLFGEVIRVYDRGVDFLLEADLGGKRVLIPGKSPYVRRFENGVLECEHLRELFAEEE